MHIKGPLTNKSFGAIVHDVNVLQITTSEKTQLYNAYMKYGVLIFPNQGHLTHDEQEKFAREFLGHLDIPQLHISNIKKKGTLLNPSASKREKIQILTQRGNEGWHMDNTYKPLSAKAGFLRAEIVPNCTEKAMGQRGETAFCDCRAAYQALPEDMKEKCKSLSAYHAGLVSQARFGEYTGGGVYDKTQVYLRPIVKFHPDTGLPNLQIGRHAFGAMYTDTNTGKRTSLAPNKSDEILDYLLKFATTSNNKWIYYHDYNVGDLVLWDNRRMLHRACPYPLTEPRVMHGNRVAGDPITEKALDVPVDVTAHILTSELERIAKNPEIKEREMAVRARI